MCTDANQPSSNLGVPIVESFEPVVEVLQLPSGLRTALVRGQHLTTPLRIPLASVCDTLDISHNDISAWPKTLGAALSPHLRNVTTLLLCHNPLQTFSAPLRNMFPHITGLSLRGTNIGELRELLYGVAGLKRLGFLDICETPLWEASEPARQAAVSALAGACKALQIVSGVRITLAHRRGRTEKG